MSDKNEYGCLMLRVTDEQLKDIVPNIPENELHEEGLDKQSHVTILYGLHEEVSWKECKEQIGNIGGIDDIVVNDISIFDNDEYDVLKFSVSSPTLHKLNGIMKKLPHQETFPVYKPHITIGYLKKGEGKKYIQDDIDLKLKPCKTLFFSNVDKQKYYWNI